MNSPLEIRRSTVIAADRERVWRAITEPEQFTKWFGDSVRFERLAVGEEMIFDFGDLVDRGAIAVVEPPERFAYRWSADTGLPHQTLVTFTLETVPGGTRVTVTEQGFEVLPEDRGRARFEDNSKGWTIQLENLAAYLQVEDHA